MKTVGFYTLGCKVNTYETEALIELYKQDNYKIVDFNEKADVYVINTCTVTNQSDSKSRKIIRRARRNNEDSCIVVAGCFSKLNEEELKELEIDIVLGVRNKEKALEFSNKFLEDKQKVYLANESVKTFDNLRVSEFRNSTRAFLKIQDGCNAFCSYCVIPYARGTVISKPIDEIINEAKSLISNGYKEIVLTGIHTGKYGIDIGLNLEIVLRSLLDLEGLYLLRLSSIEINEITDGILELLTHEKFANHLHIPLQNADDQVLIDMNRKYNFTEYLNRINEIKAVNPNINFTTDYIVGYPTESNDQHISSLEKIKEVGFSKIHVFPFSKRNGTVAAKLTDMNGLIKNIRVDDFLNLSDSFENNFNTTSINNIYEVLVETVKSDKSIGHTSNFLKVQINKKLAKNELYKVKIIEVCDDLVIGELV